MYEIVGIWCRLCVLYTESEAELIVDTLRSLWSLVLSDERRVEQVVGTVEMSRERVRFDLMPCMHPSCCPGRIT
jgi:hypothetical protein